MTALSSRIVATEKRDRRDHRRGRQPRFSAGLSVIVAIVAVAGGPCAGAVAMGASLYEL
ncbi:hypothetical protein SPDO_22240 [Sphingomonas dokdonensis]|uniref:Uncharacterized protein n=1 Tax=Sphingomonas dokdonensis TaxID=344880 RepID=A0A245ZHM9_9SPHN|nr:hypothetical protein SPDO_22240 [Sphingomonas dokdonensis]